MKNISKLFIAIFAAAFIISCSKEETIGPNDKNNIILEFDNRIGDQKLVLGTTKAKNAMGEEFTVTTLNYFVSNIALKKENGEIVKFPNSYYLIRQADANSLNVMLKDLPAANYTELSYTIGVDSLKSISDVAQRTGVLDPASYGTDNMYWSWNSGYIFFKMEGNSSVIPISAMGANQYQFHIGGYGGRAAVAPNNLRTIKFALTDVAKVRSNIAPEIHIINDISKVFNGTTQVSLAKLNSIHSPAAGTVIAENYAKGFIVDHVHNDKQ